MSKLIIGVTGLVQTPDGGRGSAGAGKDTAGDRLVEKHGFVKVSLADPLKRMCRDTFGFSDDQLWGPSEKRNEPDKAWPRPRRSGAICKECVPTEFTNPLTEIVDYGGYFGRRPCIVCGVEKPSSELTHRQLPTEYLTPRHALQQLGTEWGRECSPDVWVHQALISARTLFEESTATYTAKGGLIMSNNFSNSEDRDVRGVVIPDVRFENEFDAIRRAGGRIIRVKRMSARLPGGVGQHASEQGVVNFSDSMFDYVMPNNADIGTLHTHVDRMMDIFRGRMIPVSPDRGEDFIPQPPSSRGPASGPLH